jgi:lipoyl(octanoyl) transferase
VRWVARGGGVMPHGPGQVACFPIVHLPTAGMTAADYVRKLTCAVADALATVKVLAEPTDDPPGVVANGRRIAQIGVAVRGGTTGFGVTVNVAPDLELFRRIDPDGDSHPLTSVQRESPLPARVPAVRQALLRAIAERFDFPRTAVFHTHPLLVAHAPAVRRHGS